MSISHRRYLLLLFLFLIAPPTEAAVVAPANPAPTTTYSLADLDRVKIEARLGRKLKLKEKVGLWILKKKMKRQERRAKRTQRGAGPVDGLALASFVCGILGLVIFWPAILALVLGIISLDGLNRNPGYRTGRGFAITGIILGGIVILAFLLLVAVSASIGFF